VFKFNGSPTRHIICDMLSEIPLEKRESFAPLMSSHCTYDVFSLHPQVQSLTEITTKITAETLKIATGVAVQTKPVKQKKQIGKDKIKDKIKTNPTSTKEKPVEEIEMKAEDILKLKMEQKKAMVPPTKITSKSLGFRWVKHVSADGEYVKPLTQKQYGQLRHFHTALGEDALAALDFAVINWGKFTWEAKMVKGLASTPTEPDIGFMQQYHDVLVQLIAKKVVTPISSTIVAEVQNYDITPVSDQKQELTATVATKEGKKQTAVISPEASALLATLAKIASSE
jgi:hypothetical protein